MNDQATKNHNVSNINTVIDECATRMLEIKASRAELNEDAADIRERLSDAGIKPAAFAYALRLKEMEQEARDEYMDGLKSCFEAMSIGVQLSFLD